MDCPPDLDPIDYDDKSGLVLGGDLFYHVSPQLRLGGGLLYAPSTKMEAEGDESKLGSDLSLLAIAEGIFDVSPTTALAVRGFVGPAILMAGDDLEDANDDIDRTCGDPSFGCDAETDTSPALTFGVGGGVVFAVGSVALRADLILQWYSGKGRKVTYDSVDATFEEEISGSRTLLCAGVEF